MNTSIAHPDQRVTDLLAAIRVQLAALGIASEHLDDHQLYDVIVTTVYRLECAGQPVTLDAMIALWNRVEGVAA
jgi:hypothetical protein